MKIDEYKKIMTKPLLDRAIVFLLSGDEVLLGLKKKGFGKDFYVGIGGKIEKGETIEDGLAREVIEEIGVKMNGLKFLGSLDFYFPYIEDESWNQRVNYFSAGSWIGAPIETEEIKPVWFARDELPYDRMWDDQKIWLPKILSDESNNLNGEFLYDDKLRVADYLLR